MTFLNCQKFLIIIIDSYLSVKKALQQISGDHEGDLELLEIGPNEKGDFLYDFQKGAYGT